MKRKATAAIKNINANPTRAPVISDQVMLGNCTKQLRRGVTLAAQ